MASDADKPKTPEEPQSPSGDEDSLIQGVNPLIDSKEFQHSPEAFMTTGAAQSQRQQPQPPQTRRTSPKDTTAKSPVVAPGRKHAAPSRAGMSKKKRSTRPKTAIQPVDHDGDEIPRPPLFAMPSPGMIVLAAVAALILLGGLGLILGLFSADSNPAPIRPSGTTQPDATHLPAAGTTQDAGPAANAPPKTPGPSPRPPAPKPSSAAGDRRLVTYWRLDEGSGLGISDASRYKTRGRIEGAVAWADGKFGKALRFEPKFGDGYVIHERSPRLAALHTGDYTISAWYKPLTVPPGEGKDNLAAQAIVIKPGHHIGLYYKHDQTFAMIHWLEGNKRVAAVSAKPHPPGHWYHVAGVVARIKGKTMLYVDGKREGSADWTPDSPALSLRGQPWYVGIAHPGAGTYRWPAHGLIDEVRFYQEALAPREIATLARGGEPYTGPPAADTSKKPTRRAVLLAHWPLDDKEGDKAADATGRGRIATLKNGAQWTEGKLGGALAFDGKDDYVKIADKPDLDGSAAMSFACWVFPTRLDGAPRALLSKRISYRTGIAYSIFFHEGNHLYVDMGGAENRFASTMAFAPNKWYHVAVVYTGQERREQRVKIYIDGRKDKAGPAAERLPDSPAPLTLGTLNEGYGNHFAGQLDDVRIYQGALRLGAIRQLARGKQPAKDK